ncbi:MAG: hypothetical protein V4526_02530 [Patescibacteria group bacterium]
MYTLLPENHVRDLIRNYRGRLIAVFLFFLSLMLIFGTISLLPAYIVARGYEREAQSKAKVADAERKLPQIQDADQRIQEAEFLYKSINSLKTPFLPSAVVTAIVAARGQGVIIDAFEMSHLPEGNQLNLVVRGKASLRDNLVDFKKRLLGIPGVTKVELPISDLAKSKDLTFGLKIMVSLEQFQ